MNPFASLRGDGLLVLCHHCGVYWSADTTGFTTERGGGKCPECHERESRGEPPHEEHEMNDIHSSTRWTRKSLNGTINEVTRDGQRGFVIDVYHYQDGRYTTQITTSDGVRTEEKIDNLDYYMMRASHRPMFDTQAEAEAHIEYAAQHPELLAFGTIAFPEYALWTPESLARAHAHRKQREQEQAERDARRAQQRTAPELVACDCGHTIDRDLVMRASMGSSCPDCYDRMSN